MTATQIRYFLLSITVVFFTACGGSSGGDDPRDTAIEKISNYAQNGGEAPTLQDYTDAGVTGITNVDEINAYILGLTKEDVDTQEEIQKIAGDLGVSLSPVANIKVTRTTNTEEPDMLFPEGQSIRFSADESTDPDGTIVSYLWTEGSKTLFTIPVFDISTLSVGKHVITLTVTDNDGNSASSEVTVRIFEQEAPVEAPVAAPQTCVQEAGYETVTLANGQIWLDRDIGAVNVGEAGTLYDLEDAQNSCPCGFVLSSLGDINVLLNGVDYSSLLFTDGYRWMIPPLGASYGYFRTINGRITQYGYGIGGTSGPYPIRCIDPSTSIPAEEPS